MGELFCGGVWIRMPGLNIQKNFFSENKGMFLGSSFISRVPSGCKEKLLQTMYSDKMITRQYLRFWALFPFLICY